MEGIAGLYELVALQAVRQVLRDNLEKINPDKDWSFITSQIGMFSFTGLTPPQVSNLPYSQKLTTHRYAKPCVLSKPTLTLGTPKV